MASPLENKVFQAICSCLPGAQESASNSLVSKDLASYLSKLPPLLQKKPLESVKKLLENIRFVHSAEELKRAWGEGKQHIVWQINSYLLLAWEKGEKRGRSLKVYCAPHLMDPPPVKAGFFQTLALMVSSFFQATPQLSQWTDALKTRVSPLALSYQNVSLDMFSDQWFEALEKSEQTNWAALFSPLQDLPPAEESLEPMDRFIGGPRNTDSSWWLHKAWLRHHLPFEEYKAFHFASRLSLLQNKAGSAHLPQDRSVCSEVASKLLRSLFKHRFALKPEKQSKIEKLLQEIYRKGSLKGQYLLEARQQAHMPLEEADFEGSSSSHLPKPLDVELAHQPQKLYRTPFQWKKKKRDLRNLEFWLRPLADIHKDLIWQLERETPEQKVEALAYLTKEHELLACSVSYCDLSELEKLLICMKKRSVFKYLVAQIDLTLSESLYLYVDESTWRQLFFEYPEIHEEWKALSETLRPKNYLCWKANSWRKYNDRKTEDENLLSLLQVFSYPLDSTSACPALTPLLIASMSNFGPGRAILAEGSPALPTTTKFLQILLPLKEDRTPNSCWLETIDLENYSKESLVANYETLNPWTTPLDVARIALPHIGPEHALQTYMQLSDEVKFSKEGICLVENFLCFSFKKPLTTRKFFASKVQAKKAHFLSSSLLHSILPFLKKEAEAICLG